MKKIQFLSEWSSSKEKTAGSYKVVNYPHLSTSEIKNKLQSFRTYRKRNKSFWSQFLHVDFYVWERQETIIVFLKSYLISNIDTDLNQEGNIESMWVAIYNSITFSLMPVRSKK